jgi:hypothetical protein
MTSAVGVKLRVLGEMLSMTVESTASISGSIGLALIMAGIAMPTMVLMLILEEVSMLVGAAMPTMVLMSILEVVGDGAGESVDPDPVIPTVNAN